MPDNQFVSARQRNTTNVIAYNRRPVKVDRRFFDQRNPRPMQVLKSASVQASNSAKLSAPIAPKNFELPAKIKKAKDPSKKVNIFLVGMATTLFVMGVGVCLNTLRQNHEVRAQSADSAIVTNNSNPDETEPDKNSLDAYAVPSLQPRILTIEKLGIKARTLKVGVDKKSRLQAPSNVYDAGWYENSSKPGDTGGAILLDGHVAGPTKKGIFYNLKKLQAGDKITLERGDGKKYSFKVTKSQIYDVDKVDMNAALVSAEQGKLGLNLITCTGKFDSKTNNYLQRIVVFAVLD